MLLSAITVSFVTLRSLGAVAVVIVWPTIEAFLVWQALTCLARSFVPGAILSVAMPFSSYSTAGSSLLLLGRTWALSANISIISVESLVLIQGPRLLVSRILPLTRNSATSALRWLFPQVCTIL